MERKKIISSLAFKFVERLAVKGAGLIIGIILARLLLPEEFGQVAIITIFINLANSIIQNGFNSALVQQKEVDDKDYSTVFYITMVLSAVMLKSAPSVRLPLTESLEPCPMLALPPKATVPLTCQMLRERLRS